MCSSSKGWVVVMIVFEGCLALIIFPASQAPHKWSFLNLTPLMPMTCFFFARVCKFLMPACPSLRCQSQHSEAFARRYTASYGPAEKSTMYKSYFWYPSKTRDLSYSIRTRQRYFANITIMSRSQSVETDIKFYPRDSTSITLSMCWSFEIATLPIGPIPCFYQCQQMWCDSCQMDVRLSPWEDFDHQSYD